MHNLWHKYLIGTHHSFLILALSESGIEVVVLEGVRLDAGGVVSEAAALGLGPGVLSIGIFCKLVF